MHVGCNGERRGDGGFMETTSRTILLGADARSTQSTPHMRGKNTLGLYRQTSATLGVRYLEAYARFGLERPLHRSQPLPVGYGLIAAQ